MYNAMYAATAAPMPYQQQDPYAQQQQFQQAAQPPQQPGTYSGYPAFAAQQPGPGMQYGSVSYPAVDAGYSQGYVSAYQQPSHNSAPTYTGLDAAVYSAASAMLAERGITNTQKTYSSQGASRTGTSDWKSRVEQMNPTVPTATPSQRGSSSSRGSSFGSGRGGGGGTRGGRGSFGGPVNRYAKPKDPANQAMHYCDICKCSCAGAASYQAHLVGIKHKKREQQVQAEKAAASSNVGSAPAAASKPAVGRPINNPQLITCELCGISTAGPQVYEAHINGKSHKRTLALHMKLGKPIPQNEPTITQRTVATSAPVKSSQPTHTTGSSICTKVVTGGKTVLITPKMNFVGGTVLHTTNDGLQEVQTQGVVASAPPVPAGVPPPKAKPSPPKAAASTPKGKCVVNPNISSGEPIGEKYIEKLEKEGKVAYYKCTLCSCEFSDDSGMNSHIRGRRHRLSYKQKVDSSIVVEPSGAQRKSREKQREKMPPRAPVGKRPAPGGPRGGPPYKRGPAYPAPPQWGPGPYDGGYAPAYPMPSMGPPRSFGPYGVPTQFPRHVPQPDYYMGPPALLPLPTGGLLPPPPEPLSPFSEPVSSGSSSASPQKENAPPPRSRLDQQYLHQKHRLITPETKHLQSLEETVSRVEKALKVVADKLTFPNEDVNADTTASVAIQQKMLKGSYRFGRMNKNLLTRDNLFGEMLLVCSRHPTADNLKMVADALKQELQGAGGAEEFLVVPHPEECRIYVKRADEVPVKVEDGASQQQMDGENGEAEITFPVWIYMVYGNLRDELHKRETAKSQQQVTAADGAGQNEKPDGSIGSQANNTTADSTGDKKDPDAASGSVSQSGAQQQQPQVADMHAAAAARSLDAVGALDLKLSLAILAQCRRARWFQEFISFFPQCRMLMRILNNIFEFDSDLRVLAGWPVEFLTITVLRLQSAYHGMTPFDIPLAEAFWMILSTVSSGVFLLGCPNGFKDPCERGTADILGSLDVEARSKVTHKAGYMLNRWLTGNYATVLDVEPLARDPSHPAPLAESASAGSAGNGTSESQLMDVGLGTGAALNGAA